MGVNVMEIGYFRLRRTASTWSTSCTVRGTAPKYTEVFIDEGDIDMVQAMKVWKAPVTPGPSVPIIARWRRHALGTHGRAFSAVSARRISKYLV